MTNGPRNSINDGWRTRISLRRALCLTVAALSFFTLVSITPDSAIAASADGTQGTQVVDASGAVWTFDGERTLRDGVWVAPGMAREYLYANQTVYAITAENNVWKWTGSTWNFVGTGLGSLGASVPVSATATNLRSIVTTGSISGGSNQVTVASASGFAAGDWVIVEIGKEGGQGQRGTRGVGGTWPSKSYPTEAQLLADRSQPNRLHAWAEDTGYAYWWLDGQWFNMAPNRPNTFYTGQYYLGKAIPRSLQARITAISGNTLTLDKSAAVSTSGANVYLDTAPILSNMIANGGSVSLPAGDFATGGVVWIRDKGGVVLSGQGKDQTRIFSPKGVPSAGIQAYNAPNTLIRDLTLHGNFRDQGFGMNWTGSTTAGTNQPVTEYDVPQGSGYPRGILINFSQDSVVQDVRVIDVAWQAVGVAFSDNTWARRVVNIQNDLLRQYVQWQFQFGDSTGGGCEDCEVRSTYLISGFEAFKSTNIQFIRPKGINAVFALNGAGGWVIDGADLRFTPNSLHPESDRLAASPHHPIINVNHSFVTPQLALGGTIRNTTIIQSGYVNANNDSLKGIVVNTQNPNIRVEGAAYYAPDYKSPTVVNGAMGLDSVGPSTTVSGMQVIGKPQPGRANIFVMHGSGVNCSAQVVEGCSTGSFTTAAMQSFLAGDTSGWDLPSGSSGTGGTSSGGSSSGSGSGSTTTTPPAPQTPSANGTRGAQVVDSSGAVWTFENAKTLRNGVWMNGGYASEYLYVNSTVYAINSDGGLWKWSNSWSYVGTDIAALTGSSSGSGSSGSGSSGSGSSGSGSSTSGSGSGSTATPPAPQTPSANGTRGTQVVDSSGAVWTFENTKTLSNGVWMNGGYASEYLYVNSTVYAISSDGGLWKWSNSWSYVGTDIAALTGSSSGSGSSGSSSSGSGSSGSGSSTSGSGSGSTATPPAPQTPSANGTRGAQVVDSSGAVWTFENTKTLSNGVWMNGGYASEYLYVNSTVYAISSDGGLWKWSNSWSYVGTDIAALTGSSSGSGSSGTGSSTGSGSPATSAHGTRGKQVVDATGAVWTFDGTKTLRNGVWMGPGSASEYLYVNSTVYAITSDGGLWKWSDSWSYVGTDIAALTGGSSGSSGTPTTAKKPSVAMDFSGNGTSSILWRNDAVGQNVIWSINKGTVAKQTVITATASNWDVLGSGDFNADGKADILWRDNEGNVAVWLMDGTSVAGGGVVANAPTNWKVEGVGDFNGDGKSDILWRATDGSVSVWLMDSATIAARGTLVSMPKAYTLGGIGDLNKDGKADVVWRNSDGSIVSWLMDGAKIDQTIATGSEQSVWALVGVADFNGDGKADLLWRNTVTGQNSVWHMDGGIQASTVTLPALSDTKWKVAAIGDYNGDGKADILWRHSQKGNNALWLLNGAQVSKPAIPAVSGLSWTVVKP